MKTILSGRFSAGFVYRVARIATHIERRVTAALGGNVQALLVAGKAEVFFLAATCCFQQLVLVIRGMRIVTLQTVPYCRAVNRTLDVFSEWQVMQSPEGVVVISLTRVMSFVTRTS